jgi:hypothetical protein
MKYAWHFIGQVFHGAVTPENEKFSATVWQKN